MSLVWTPNPLVLGRNQAVKQVLAKSRMKRIQQMIAECSDRKLLKLLNRAWWKEWFTNDGRNESSH